MDRTAENQKWKWDGYSNRKDNSRWKICKPMGKEFYNANVQKTQHKSLFKIMKAFIVERFNRTLKNDMWKQFTHNGNDKSIDLHVSCLSTTRESIDMWHIDVTPTIADILLITRLTTTYTRCSIKAVTFPIQNGWLGTYKQIQDNL